MKTSSLQYKAWCIFLGIYFMTLRGGALIKGKQNVETNSDFTRNATGIFKEQQFQEKPRDIF